MLQDVSSVTQVRLQPRLPGSSYYQVVIWSSISGSFPGKITHFLDRALKDQPIRVSFVQLRRTGSLRLSTTLAHLRRAVASNQRCCQIHVIVPNTAEVLESELSTDYFLLLRNFIFSASQFSKNHQIFFCNFIFPSRISEEQSQEIELCNINLSRAFEKAQTDHNPDFHFIDLATPLSENCVYPTGDLDMFESDAPSFLNAYGLECLAAELSKHIASKSLPL
jgi:hypothetical protein